MRARRTVRKQALLLPLCLHSHTLCSLIHVLVAAAAIGTTLTFIDSQQPFPYVHLLALLTDLALCVNAATVGLQTGRQLYDPSTLRTELPLLAICAVVRVSSFVLIYSGLLATSVHLENPLGDDPADLPALAYQVEPSRAHTTACSAPCHHHRLHAVVFAVATAAAVAMSPPLGVATQCCGSSPPTDWRLESRSWQVWMRKECESFAAAVDAVDLDANPKWWEGLGPARSAPPDAAAK